MSARKIGSIETPKQQVTIGGRQSSLELSTDAVAIHKSGIEFRSPTPFNEWTEMTVALQSPHDGAKLQCSGVVIACSGNKHTGYRVSMVFTGLTDGAQAQLNSMARSELGAG
ncbi:MAG: PilZ domain-containing protein [Verrucomicrobiales bacterium]|nr:PilZ domain-containing protein [Verrucomicrobiales bacterium]